jgi:hypothetical protein
MFIGIAVQISFAWTEKHLVVILNTGLYPQTACPFPGADTPVFSAAVLQNVWEKERNKVWKR